MNSKMKRIDPNERAYNSSETRMNIIDDPKLKMLPVVFTKKLDKMDLIDTNWKPLSLSKIITIMLEESKPEYNPMNISTSKVRDIKSYNKLEDKLKTYLQSTKSQYDDINLKSIIEMALNNIKASTVNQNVQNEYNQSSAAIQNEPESWSSDDNEALVTVIKRKTDTPKDTDNQMQNTTENNAYNKLEDKLKSYLQSTKSQNKELNLKNINEMALSNIKASTVNQNIQNEYNQSSAIIKNEPESWSSDDDEALVTVIERKTDTPKDTDNQMQNTTEDNAFNKLEDKLKTYLQSTRSQYNKINLKNIYEMALSNIKASTFNQNIQNEYNQSSATIKNEPESWSSDDDEALVTVIERKTDTPKNTDNQIQNKTDNNATTKSHKTMENKFEIFVHTPINNTSEQSQINTTKVQVKTKKDTATVAEVQSQLKEYNNIISSIRNSRKVAKKSNNVLIKMKRRNPPKDVVNKSQTKNAIKVPATPNINTKIITTSNIEHQSQNENQTKAPAKQNENKSPIAVTNTVQKIKKKIKYQNFDGMSIFFFNTGLMAKQQKVTEERYDIGNDGALEKFFVQSQPPRDRRRYSIEKTVCCLYKRAQVITEILDEYDISPTAVNFLRAAHLCEVGACLCCCKPNRSAPQSDAALTSRILDRNAKTSLISSQTPHASSSGSSLRNQNIYATNNIMKTISAHYKISLALKGLITSLLTNFKGITLTAGSTGKLSAIFNTTFTSWNNTDLQLLTAILTKMRKELFVSQIPPKDFCDCVNEALNKDNLFSQASTLLGEKQLLMLKQYSLAYFLDEKLEKGKDKETKLDNPKIEHFRGDPKLLNTSPIPGPSSVLNQENEETKAKRKRRTIRNDNREKDQPSKKSKRSIEQSTKRKLRNTSPKPLRECIFVAEPAPEESALPNNSDNSVVEFKNPILQQMLVTSTPQSTLPGQFGVTQIPLQYLVSVPVKENKSEQVPLNNISQTENIITITEVPLNNSSQTDNIISIKEVPLNIPQTNNIDTIDLSSDEETILS